MVRSLERRLIFWEYRHDRITGPTVLNGNTWLDAAWLQMVRKIFYPLAM